MARRDVINYYLMIQAQYLEMLEDTQDFDKALKDGLVSQEMFDQAQEIISKLKENYDRISYIITLLNEPNRQDKKEKHKKQNRLVYDFLDSSTSSSDYIKKENEDVLKKFKELIKKANEK